MYNTGIFYNYNTELRVYIDSRQDIEISNKAFWFLISNIRILRFLRHIEV